MRLYKHQNQQKESEADTQLMNNETKDLEVFKIHSKTESCPQKLPIFFSGNVVANCHTADTDIHKKKHFQKKNQSKPNKQQKNSSDNFTEILRIFQKSDRDV